MTPDPIKLRSRTSQVEETAVCSECADLRSLIEAIAERKDGRAFAELHRRFAPRAFALARTITGNAEDAADAVQEAMLRIWKSAAHCRPEQLGSWLRQIVVRESIKKLKWRRRGLAGAGVHFQQVLDASHPSTPEAKVEKSERAVRLRSLVGELPGRDRDLLTLYFENGCSQGNIARRMALPQRTVSYRLKGILNLLRSRFMKGHQASLVEVG